MELITFDDISRRIRSLGVVSVSESRKRKSPHPRLYTENHIFCRNNALNAITNWESMGSTTNEAFNNAYDVYTEVCISGNASTIKTCTNYMIEAVNKVRDASQLLNSLKYKNARLKGKINTKIKKAHNNISDEIQKAIDAVKIISLDKKVDMPDDKRQETVEECLNLIMREAKKIKECDRIINNYSKVSKRYNLDRTISEITSNSDMYVTIMEIASYIDTYHIPFKNKFSHALELAYYGLNKYNMNCSNEKIIEAVTDYFVLSRKLSEEDIESIKETKDNSVLFSDDDFDVIAYIMDDDSDTSDDLVFGTDPSECIESYCMPYTTLTENLLKDINKQNKEVKKAAKSLVKDAKKGNPEERVDKGIKDEIDEFRKQCAKDPDNKNNIARLKSMVNSIFTKSPEQIVYALPNIFDIILGILMIFFVPINPILSLVGFITNQTIKLTLSRKQTEKVVKAYQNEIDTVNGRIEKAKDEKSKEYLEKYLAELKKDYAKIKDYENNLYSEDENWERDTSTEYNTNKDDDFDFDDDWGDFDFEEVASIIYIADKMQSISEGLIEDNLDGIIFGNIFKLDNDSIDSLADFSITVPTILEKDKLSKSLIDYRNSLRETATTAEDYIRIDCLNENIYKLNNNTMVYSTSNNLSGVRCYLACLNEMVRMNGSSQYVTEMNFTNTLKLAIDRLKKTAVNLKDKDKQASNSIDVAVNNISKGLEQSMMNGNREAVIQGKILPSASKCIKIACTLGVAWAINPAISVIMAIGGFACSAKLRSKERKLILDDIEIELKMCERYLRQAEDSGDLKKVREIEKIQRNLQRQQQRLKYRMKVVYHQDVPNAPDDDNN